MFRLKQFTRTVGGKRRFDFVILYESAHLVGGQKVVPRPKGYKTRAECKADMELLRREINSGTPIELVDE